MVHAGIVSVPIHAVPNLLVVEPSRSRCGAADVNVVAMATPELTVTTCHRRVVACAARAADAKLVDQVKTRMRERSFASPQEDPLVLGCQTESSSSFGRRQFQCPRSLPGALSAFPNSNHQVELEPFGIDSVGETQQPPKLLAAATQLHLPTTTRVAIWRFPL